MKKNYKIILLLVLAVILLMALSSLLIINFPEINLFYKKYFIRFRIFNLIFLFNMLLVISERYSKYWYLVYVFQIFLVLIFK